MASTKKPISQKKADKEKQDNQVLSRVYYVFLIGLVVECYLFLVYRGYAAGGVNSVLAWHSVLRALMWAGLVLLVGAAAVGYVKREDRKLRKIMCWAAGAGGFFALSGWVITHFFDNGLGVTAMCVLVPIVAILALVYLLYQHECALSTVALGGAMFCVWARGVTPYSTYWKIPVISGCVLGLVLLGLAAYLVSQAQKDEGRLKKVQVLSLECDYRVLYAALAVAAVGVVIGLLVPAISVYLMWLLGVALFAELVFYTTKLL